MKKVLKLVGWVIVAILVVLGVASVALHILLPPEKAKALVLKQLTAHLKRQVTVGTVDVGVLTGLSLSDLKISESPDFSKGTFISSDHFSIRLALLPLLFRKIEVNEVVLDHPVIQVVRYEDGKTFNFSDLLESATIQKPVQQARGISPFAIPEAYADTIPSASPKQPEPSFALLVSNAQVHKGVVRFIDRSPDKQSMDIDALDLKLKNVSMTSPFSVQTSLQVKARNVVATLQVSGDADLATESFKIKNCALSSGGSTIELAGTANRLRSNQPSVDLTLNVKEFKLATLAPFIALPPGLKLDGPIVANARVKGDQKKMDLVAQADLEKVQVVYGKQFHKPAKVPMWASFKGAVTGLQDLDLTELKIVLGSIQLLSHGKVLAVASADPQISLHLESNTFAVSDLSDMGLLTLPKDVSVKGKAQFAADVSGTKTSSRIASKLDGKTLDITFGDLFHKPADLPLRVSLLGEWIQRGGAAIGKPTRVLEQTFTIQNMTAGLGSSEVTASGSVLVSAVPPRFQLVVKSNSIALQEVARLSPLLTTYRLNGTAGFDAHTSGTADSPVINGSLTLRNGSLHYEQSDLTGISTGLTFTLQDVNIPRLTGKLNGSDITLKLVGHRLKTQPDINVEANITELDLAKLLPALPTQNSGLRAQKEESLSSAFCTLSWAAGPPAAMPPAKLSGHLTVGHIKHEFYDAKNLDCKWNLSEVTPDLSRVSGTADLKQGAGVLKDVEKLAQSSKSARIVLQPIITLQNLDKKGLLKGFGVPSLQRIPFTGIRGDYVLHTGVMDVKTFDLIGNDLNLNTTGTITLPEPQPLSLHVVMKLAAGSLRGDLGQLTADASGRPTLPFTITGTASQPQVKPELQDIGRKAMQKYGGDLLKGLGLGGGQQQTPPPPSGGTENLQAPPPDSNAPAQPKSADDLQKALKNIFH